jgi:hypothetical protein
VVEGWPAAVGDAIARNAWPARIARDGTVHVNTADSIWAFELAHRAAEIASRLGVPKVRFAPGPLPEQTPGTAPPEPARPAPEHERAAAELAAAIEDENLRESVKKALKYSLARSAADRPV